MSHFTVVVLIPQDKVPEPGHPDFDHNLQSAVEQMLAPFDESIDVAPYPRKCNCAGYASMKGARIATETKTGLTIENLRADWRVKTDEEREQTTWKAFIKPYTSVYDGYYEDLMSDAKPETTCEECHGTGFYDTTYNPLSKWDWYSIGGRWDGHYKEEGVATISPNVAFARDLQSAAYAPFALLSPRESHQKQHHANWSEKGHMGWFAMVTNENDNWPAIVNELLDKYSSCLAVLVDCHI